MSFGNFFLKTIWEDIITTYGFRLFAATLHNGRKHKCQSFSDCNGEHYLMIAKRYIQDLAHDTRVGEPADLTKDGDGQSVPDSSETGTYQKPATRFADPILSGCTLRGSVYAGRFGAHDAALSTNQDVADLKKMAASRTFRYILALPDEGEQGLLAVEDISRSCPASMIVKWLKYQSQAAVMGNGRGKADRFMIGPWWRLRIKALTDHDRLRKLIEQGKMERIEVVKKTITPERTRREEKYRISAPILGVGKAQDVATLAQSWLRHSEEPDDLPRDDSFTDQAAARQLAAIVGPEIAELELDDGWLVVEGDPGIKRISPSRISEIFTYPQSKDRTTQVDDDSFYQGVRSAALRIRDSARLNIDWSSF